MPTLMLKSSLYPEKDSSLTIIRTRAIAEADEGSVSDVDLNRGVAARPRHLGCANLGGHPNMLRARLGGFGLRQIQLLFLIGASAISARLAGKRRLRVHLPVRAHSEYGPKVLAQRSRGCPANTSRTQMSHESAHTRQRSLAARNALDWLGRKWSQLQFLSDGTQNCHRLSQEIADRLSQTPCV